MCEDTGTYKLDLNEIRPIGEALSKDGNVKAVHEAKHKSKSEPPTQIQQTQPQTQNAQYANVFFCIHAFFYKHHRYKHSDLAIN